MPELPEVEVVKRSLQKIFAETPIVSKVVCHRQDLRFPLPLDVFKTWKNVRVRAVHRRAKYLLIETEKGSVVSHLGMTGNFRLIAPTEDRRTHDHIEFHLRGGGVLVFEDPRRFGFFLRWPGNWDKVTREKLGLEPFSEEWSADSLKSAAQGRRTPIKTLLMDQKVVVGIGNIYASEILFRSGIKPTRSASRISREECERIVRHSREVLFAAIQHGGSSIRDFHSPSEEEGGFQNSHHVYDREKKPCVKCSTPIRRKVVSGRSTFWCSRCQT
jgi:formamidopyrimidine-DNA glycosylase